MIFSKKEIETMERCTSLETVNSTFAWLDGVTHIAEEGEPGYEDQQVSLDQCMKDLESAVNDKPPGCQLEGSWVQRNFLECINCDIYYLD